MATKSAAALRLALVPETLIVAQTGWGQDQDRQRSPEAGFDAHFTKPVDDEALLQLLADGAGPRGHRADAAP